ncbi:MAG: hypothetical protein RBJ76_13825 [Stenomitos frigidus ULC029]
MAVNRKQYTTQLTRPYAGMLRALLASALSIADRYEVGNQQRKDRMLVLVNTDEVEADLHNLELLAGKLVEHAKILGGATIDMDQTALIKDREYGSFEEIFKAAPSPTRI